MASERIAALLAQFAPAIEEYYADYAQSADTSALAAAAQNDASGGNWQALHTALSSGAWHDASDAWLRAQVTPKGSPPAALWRAHRASLHARWAAGVAEAIVTYASPAPLWWWHTPVFELFDAALSRVDLVDGARGVLSFVRLCGAAPSVATRYYAKERDRIGKGMCKQIIIIF